MDVDGGAGERYGRSMIRLGIVVLVALLTCAGEVAAQAPGPHRYPPPPPRPSPPLSPEPPPQRANICSTEWGWCPLPHGTVMAAGFPCACTDPRTGQALPGYTRAFNYTQYPRPVSPYLNPHWSP
jgi:hypothetical protein